MRTAFISQYKAGLKMLISTIEKCPDDLWDKGGYDSTYWRIVYHALFYTAFYLSENADTFIPWEKHQPDYHRLGVANDDGALIVVTDIYSKDELLDYASSIYNNLETTVNNTHEGQESGFDWLPMDKFELHIYNIRHMQHHTGQLIERLHQNGIKGINWVGRVKESKSV